jgi:hypothetical protein
MCSLRVLKKPVGRPISVHRHRRAHAMRTPPFPTPRKTPVRADPRQPIPVAWTRELAVDTEMSTALTTGSMPGSTTSMAAGSLSSLLGALTANLTPERTARMAARQAFVDLKRAFIDAAALIPGESGDRLRQHVRQANDPLELWHVRALIVSLLPGDQDERAAFARRRVKAQMQNVFADTTIGTTREF